MKPSPMLMIPGPTPLPEQVREAMSRPAIGHRSPEFKAILERVFPRLQWIFQTQHDVMLYTASGTGAGEAALMNTLNPGDKMLAVTCGVFSERWAEVGETLGLDVERLSAPHGQPNLAEALKARLDQDTDKTIKAVTLIHSETSTGVLNPIKELLAVVKAHGALSIVDAVTSLGATSFPVDLWEADLVFSGSQKGFMIPPGLSFLSVGPKAWEAHQQCKQPGYYFNFKRYKKAQDGFTTPYTPATHLIMALDEALALMEAEGLDPMACRHHQLRNMVRAGARALGLTLLVEDDSYASTAVTAIRPPEGVSVADIRKGLKNTFGITVADGQKDLKGNIFRIGHLGFVGEREVYTVLAALEHVLQDLKVSGIQPGAAVQAAQQVALSIKSAGPMFASAC